MCYNSAKLRKYRYLINTYEDIRATSCSLLIPPLEVKRTLRQFNNCKGSIRG